MEFLFDCKFCIRLSKCKLHLYNCKVMYYIYEVYYITNLYMSYTHKSKIKERSFQTQSYGCRPARQLYSKKYCQKCSSTWKAAIERCDYLRTTNHPKLRNIILANESGTIGSNLAHASSTIELACSTHASIAPTFSKSAMTLLTIVVS